MLTGWLSSVGQIPFKLRETTSGGGRANSPSGPARGVTKYPWRRRIRVPPETGTFASGARLQTFQFPVSRRIAPEPPCKTGTHEFAIEIPPVRQDEDG